MTRRSAVTNNAKTVLVACPVEDEIQAQNRRIPRKKPFNEHLGLGYLAAMLRKHSYEVKIIDAEVHDMTFVEFKNAIIKAHPQVIGIFVFYRIFPFMARLIKEIRVDLPNTIFVGGGPLLEFEQEKKLLIEGGLDCFIRGEGELTFLELVQCINDGTSWYDVPGICYCNNGEVTHTAPRKPIDDIDQLPFPSRDTLIVAAKARRNVWATMQTSRGCIYRCSFCSINASFVRDAVGPMRRQRSIDNIVEEIRFLINEVGIKKIFFTDNEFFPSGKAGRRHVLELAKSFIDNRFELQFHLLTRAHNIDYECFHLLKKAGMVKVFVGFESFIQRTLDFLQKDTTVEQNIGAIKILKKLGIEFGMGLITADPYTTIEEIKTSIEYLKEFDLMAKAISHLNMSNSLVVYPGTPIYERLKAEAKLQGSMKFGGIKYNFEDSHVPIFLKMAKHVSDIWSFLYGIDMINIQYQPHGENKKKRMVQEANSEFMPKAIEMLERTSDILLEEKDITVAEKKVRDLSESGFHALPKGAEYSTTKT